MSLRLRLLLVILAVALPTGAAGYLAARVLNGIQTQIHELSPTAKVRATPALMLGRTYSIEGIFRPGEGFLADDIEELPWSRRPKLRAAVQNINPTQLEFTLLGQTIRYNAETEHTQSGETTPTPPLLEVGQRVEVSCAVDSNGRWTARKIETGAVKAEDKIKGTITQALAQTESGAALSIDGLTVQIPPKLRIQRPSGPMYRLEVAAQLALQFQECLASAQALLKEGYRRREALARQDPASAENALGLWTEAYEQVEDGLSGFERVLESSLAHEHELARALASNEKRAPVAAIELLEPLRRELPELRRYVLAFLELADGDLDLAAQYLPETVEPYVRTRLAPLVNTFRDHSEQAVSEGLGAIAERADSAVRVTFAAAILGLALAMLLGWLVVHSIVSPIRALESAARRIGAGDLTAEVKIHSAREITLLAQTFNRMSAQLASTMVSVGNLNGILDSLAGGLFLLDQHGRITNVNPAARQLLGYGQEELLGQELARLCGSDNDSQGHSALVACSERSFHCKNGDQLPVSFAGAALHDERGQVRGFVCLIQDLRQRKRLEESLRQSIADKELLMRELHHRVKNNLQVISSLLDMQSRGISDPQSLEKFQESQDRIRSMVLIHEQLYKARESSEIHMRWYLELLTNNLTQSHLEDPGRIRIRLELDDVRLDLDRALSCGLIVNELVTNALKHAFPHQERGEILVRLKQQPPAALLLEVKDSGRGFGEDGKATLSNSLGMGLVEALTRQLQGTLSLEVNHGATFRIEFAAPECLEVA